MLEIPICKAHGFGCKFNFVHPVRIIKLFQGLDMAFWRGENIWQQIREFPQSVGMLVSFSVGVCHQDTRNLSVFSKLGHSYHAKI